ncbi:Uncharacterized protein DBV15_07943 [Temnothorax longispinosus]|uniref:Uncharacterized protein n=1 Tax=Temnothorax longispinosus TaxID=300112 RepID=A0A4S2KS18_9HYME|nr:Uncharacterized protein DBV15_07943 [Temnothorax longispinosus]
MSRRRQVELRRTRPAKETNLICGDKTLGEGKKEEGGSLSERACLSDRERRLIGPSGTWTMTNEKPCPFWFAHVTTTTTAILARYPIRAERLSLTFATPMMDRRSGITAAAAALHSFKQHGD